MGYWLSSISIWLIYDALPATNWAGLFLLISSAIAGIGLRVNNENNERLFEWRRRRIYCVRMDRKLTAPSSANFCVVSVKQKPALLTLSASVQTVHIARTHLWAAEWIWRSMIRKGKRKIYLFSWITPPEY